MIGLSATRLSLSLARFSFRVISLLLLLGGELAEAAAEEIVIADFEGDTGGFQGKITAEEGDAKEGKGAGRMEADLTDVTQSAWITAKKPLDLQNEIEGLSFWVKTTDAKQITVRLDDSTKQVFQVRPSVEPNGEWQEVKIDSFTSGPGFQSYGGAGDKQVHWPATNLHFILEKNGLTAGKGAVLIDRVALRIAGPVESATPSAAEIGAGSKPTVIADFEEGSDLNGKIEQDTAVAHGGRASGRIEADLAEVKQSAWVTVTKPLDFKNEIRMLRFWVKSAEAKQITVRLVDRTGQNLQLRPAIKPNNEWQQVTITSFEAGPGFQAYGGAGDKKPHWPAKSLAFIVEKNGLEGGRGTVWIDDVEVFLGGERLVGKLDLGQAQPGNIFFLGERVRLPVETQGDQVSWTVTDFWGKEVDAGAAAVSGKQAVAEPAVQAPGYYEVRLAATQGGAPLAEGSTTFVITTPFDLAKVAQSPFGLMTHFAQSWPVDLMPIIARCGVKHIRDELYWGHVEAKKGEYAFKDQFERYMAAAKDNHLDPLIVLSFGNPHYDHTPNAPGYGNAPYTDEGRAGYARYAQEVLKHYGSQIKAVEIWNEYNGTFGKGPAAQDKPKYYFEMLKTSYEAIKKTRPDVTVVGISAVATPFPYFEDLFRRGALQYMDALSLHPYRTQSTPEGIERLMAKLQDLIKKYNNGQPKPIWITELGWYVKPPGNAGELVITEADQAKYLARAITLTLGAGVEKFYWYHARDDKAFPNSGIVRSPEDPKGRYAPKPAYAAYATLTRQLTGAAFARREPVLNGEVYSMLFRRGTEEVRVMWSLAPATLAAKAAAPLTVVDLVGGSAMHQSEDGEVQLKISDMPVYVTGPITSLPPLEKEAGQVVADSEEEFSSEQGADGWSYGFYTAASPEAAYDPARWQPLPQYKVTIWGYEWVGDHKYLTLTPTNAHPAAAGGQPVWAVRRWTSDVAGNVRIKGQFRRGDKGDGSATAVFVDGKEVWRQQVGGGQPVRAALDITVPVKTGSLVDFAVTPGPAADIGYDATASSATITHLP